MQSVDIESILKGEEDAEDEELMFGEPHATMPETVTENLRRLMIKIHEKRAVLSEGYMQKGCKVRFCLNVYLWFFLTEHQ